MQRAPVSIHLAHLVAGCRGGAPLRAATRWGPGRAKLASRAAGLLVAITTGVAVLLAACGHDAPRTNAESRAVTSDSPAVQRTGSEAGTSVGTPPSVPLAPVRVQEIGLAQEVPDCCRVTVVRAETTEGGGVRLLLRFELTQPGWDSDNVPATLAALVLSDERGRRVPLLEVSGRSAMSDPTATTLDGWYRFGPLPPGVRRVSFAYPVYSDLSLYLTFDLDLGAVASGLTSQLLSGAWRTALVSGPYSYAELRAHEDDLWRYERVEFLPDGRALLHSDRDGSAEWGRYVIGVDSHLAVWNATGQGTSYAVEEFSDERLVLRREAAAGSEWIVLARSR